MKIKGSWKTTIAAILGLVSLLALQLANLLDDDPATMFDWALIGTHLPVIFGLLFARDNDVSSQDVGIRKEEPRPQAPATQPPINSNQYGSRGRGY
jgi:hypothetical protein